MHCGNPNQSNPVAFTASLHAHAQPEARLRGNATFLRRSSINSRRTFDCTSLLRSAVSASLRLPVLVTGFLPVAIFTRQRYSLCACKNKFETLLKTLEAEPKK
jgi:hypothetical protein